MSNKGDIPLWVSKDEWRLVYAWLYSDDVETAKRGCARLQAWKARSTRAAIPFPLENTAELIQCRVSEATVTSNEPFLQQGYAMAITRFVNGVCEYRYDQCKLKESVFVALHAMSVPSWVVMLRHSATHGKMPSLTLLKSAAEFALKWLKDNYWEKQIALTIAQQHNSTEDTRKLAYIKAILKERWENILKVIEKTVEKKTKQKKKRNKKNLDSIALKLSTLSKKDLTELIRDGSFLVPNPFDFPGLFELENVATDQIETFPVMLVEINSMWSRPLQLLHKYNSSSISTIMIVLAEGVHDTSLSHFVTSYMAAWLGELLGDRYLDITKGVNWEELLAVTYSKPGAYSYAIMKMVGEKLSALNNQFVFSDQFSLLLESTRLLSAAERILPALKPKRSYIFAPQDDYAVNVNKRIKEIEKQDLISDTDVGNPWKKNNALVDWTHVPLGQVPSQEVTGTSLELPVQLDDEPTTAHTSRKFAPRLGTAVVSSLVLELSITRKRKFSQTDLSKIHTCSETIAKI